MNKKELDLCKKIAKIERVTTTETYDITTSEYNLFTIDDNCRATGEYNPLTNTLSHELAVKYGVDTQEFNTPELVLNYIITKEPQST